MVDIGRKESMMHGFKSLLNFSQSCGIYFNLLYKSDQIVKFFIQQLSIKCW